MIRSLFTIWLSMSIQTSDNLYGALRSVNQIVGWGISNERKKIKQTQRPHGSSGSWLNIYFQYYCNYGVTMGWLEKATLDLRNAEYEPKVTDIVREFVMENTWNTPFIIKTGRNPNVKNKVNEVLYTMTSNTICTDEEIEVLDV